jgi:glycosyltransferase involved in cell wall biosynthesis
VVLAKEEDRRLFPARDRAMLDVLPNGARVPAAVPPPADGPPTLLFIGSLDYEPNGDAIRQMVGQVMPRVWLARPDATFQIVGRGRVPWIRELVATDGRIRLAENAADVEPYYREASIVVAPVRLGSGTRIKVLEALAFGRALVSTTFAAGGCGLADGVQIAFADGPDAFAARCVALLNAPAERARLGAAGRAFVISHYDWANIEAMIPPIVARAVGRRSAGAA